MTREPVPRREISGEELQVLYALATCQFSPGVADRRFILHMAAAARHPRSILRLTEGQRAYLWRLGYRYRHQLPPAINELVTLRGRVSEE